MGKFKDVGNPALALAEECAEVIQVINKLYRFGGDWNEVPEGKDVSRWAMLCSEMEDLMYQFRRLEREVMFPDLATLADQQEEMKYQQ
jgi:hypothetical protein